ncbi:uncharacterized protein L201_007505 [Kwoniella dendrophila CBS 6074]|uniref:Uncharacterized protein n=1 Tax=Kwoniella dendrophila CBS 6074 TaxID=1295534 RepID=A0AAX4K494_9TREE
MIPALRRDVGTLQEGGAIRCKKDNSIAAIVKTDPDSTIRFGIDIPPSIAGESVMMGETTLFGRSQGSIQEKGTINKDTWVDIMSEIFFQNLDSACNNTSIVESLNDQFKKTIFRDFSEALKSEAKEAVRDRLGATYDLVVKPYMEALASKRSISTGSDGN